MNQEKYDANIEKQELSLKSDDREIHQPVVLDEPNTHAVTRPR